MIDSDSQPTTEALQASDAIEAVALEALGPGTISRKCSGFSEEGITDDGRTTFLPKHIEGQRIDQYCDTHRLDVPSRLELFCHVCRAVHVAHQHAVIHGHLNPSNILVTSEGVPKLIDSEVHDRQDAAVDPKLEPVARLTQADKLVLTPEYASPEQVKGEIVTTSTDIYALGVILYELLTGRRPYQFKTGSTSDIFQAICEQVPEKPSISVVQPTGNWMNSSDPVSATAVLPSGSSPEFTLSAATTPSHLTSTLIAAARGCSPEGLKRILREDLDAITSMAMRKEPERRYASADQFADDLERHRKGLPVRAHVTSAMYRGTKFIRRHVKAVTVSTVLVLTLLAGIVGTVMGLIMASRERDRAETSFHQARQSVNQLFSRVSDEKLFNQPGMYPLRDALLQDAQRFYEDFLNRRGGDPSLRAELAGARTRVARISNLIGSNSEAIGQFEQAVALWDGLIAVQPANPSYREELARTLNEQGTVLMRLNGQRDEALRIFRRAQEMIEPIVDNSASAQASYEFGLILQNIGEIQRQQGQSDEAIKNVQRSLAIESRLAGVDSNSLDALISMAKGHALLGQMLIEQPDGLEPALVDYQEAVSLQEKVTRKHPEWPDQTILMATFLNELCQLQQMAGKLDSALASAQKAMEMLERIDQQHPGVLNYQVGLASAYNLISDVHRHRREPDEAITSAQKAKTLLERLISIHPEDVASRIELAKSQNNLGRLLQQTGEPVEALQSFQRAVDLYESLSELDARNSYNLACNLALSIPLIGVKNGSTEMTDVSKLSKNDQLRRGRYGNRALDVLRRAIAGGFLNLDILRSDTDLNAIRDRPDFQDLIKETEQKTTIGKNQG